VIVIAAMCKTEQQDNFNLFAIVQA